MSNAEESDFLGTPQVVFLGGSLASGTGRVNSGVIFLVLELALSLPHYLCWHRYFTNFGVPRCMRADIFRATEPLERICMIKRNSDTGTGWPNNVHLRVGEPDNPAVAQFTRLDASAVSIWQ